MVDVATAPAPVAAPAKAPKVAKPKKAGSSKTKKPSNHPKYAQMIKEALTTLKERGGSSRQALLKYIVKHYNLGQEEKIVNAHLKLALRAGVKGGSLKQSKGTGAAGSFRLGEKKAEEKKKPKKAGAKKVKKPAGTGKPKTAKKAAKPKKAKAAGSPKKAAKPKKPKAAAKPKSPKKAKVVKPKVAKVKSPKAKKPKAAGRPKKAATKK